MMWGDFHTANGVHHWGSIPYGNASAYLETRKREGRLLEDDLVKDLPKLPKTHPLHAEWKKRQDTAKRFRLYQKMNSFKSALEIGCGNGWFSNMLAQTAGMERVVGLDVNQPELEQAARVFADEKIQWFCSDIFQWDGRNIQFDLIVLNASVQYFQNIERLLMQCRQLLNPGGELHILDSKFYHTEEMVAAQQRSKTYYRELGTPEMAGHYYHHNWDSVTDLQILYRPRRSMLGSFLRPNASPFPWLCYKKKA